MSTATYESSSFTATAKATCKPSINPPQLPQSLPAGFDSQLAYLLGLCCNSANDQYAAYVTNTRIIYHDTTQFDPKNWGIESVKPKPWDPDFSQIISLGYKPDPTHFNLSVYETDATGKPVEIPAGFIVRLDRTDTKKSSMIVVAFHGTQNSFELNKIDYDPIPAPFGMPLPNLGSVHGGFYAQYTTGSDGHQGDLVGRAPGSLVQQIYDYFNDNNVDGALPVKVTGHSLGGALATLSALDIAFKFNSKFKSISMYSLAGPRVADALYKKDPSGKIDPSGAGEFVSNYQKYVPDSYRIVNTVDPVPHSPSAIVPPPPPPRFPPPIWIPANVFAHVLGDNDAIKDGIVSPNPSLDQNVVSFTDENPQNNNAGSPQECQGPHSCPAVYVPFLKRLSDANAS
jgi:hypothetical protein